MPPIHKAIAFRIFLIAVTRAVSGQFLRLQCGLLFRRFKATAPSAYSAPLITWAVFRLIPTVCEGQSCSCGGATKSLAICAFTEQALSCGAREWMRRGQSSLPQARIGAPLFELPGAMIAQMNLAKPGTLRTNMCLWERHHFTSSTQMT